MIKYTFWSKVNCFRAAVDCVTHYTGTSIVSDGDRTQTRYHKPRVCNDDVETTSLASPQRDAAAATAAAAVATVAM